MKKWLFVFLYSIPVVLIANAATARSQDSDYMACSIVDNGNFVSILVIPQSYLGTFGREEAIVRRSCDSQLVKKSFGWTTEYNCTKQMQQLNQILQQLQSSKACPNTGRMDTQNTEETNEDEQ